jgi:hypothetical protein
MRCFHANDTPHTLFTPSGAAVAKALSSLVGTWLIPQYWATVTLSNCGDCGTGVFPYVKYGAS